MVPMPIIGEPFKQIAMDVVRLLPKTKKGHHYILVVCDYATRYPEAFPLRTFTAPTVAEKQIKMFALSQYLKILQGHDGTLEEMVEMVKMANVVSQQIEDLKE